jgi:NCS1 nucleoside transporter family
MATDAEKGNTAPVGTAKEEVKDVHDESAHDLPPNEDFNPMAPKGSALNRFLRSELFETRGIERVPPSAQIPFTARSALQAFILWVSVNLAAVNVTLGMLGPQVFYLSFTDSALCAVFGAFLGSLGVSYMALWGPRGGVRTMVVARFVMGWYPTKLIVLLNLLQQLGYSLINCVVAGQILSAVSPQGSLNIVVGIIIVAVITWLVTTFGIKVFHFYERYAFIPQIVVLCILYGYAGPNFDTSTPSTGDVGSVIAARLSFFSICLSAAITYSPMSADYFVYYTPPRRPFMSLFLPTLAGLTVSFTFALVLGAGLASATTTHPAYAAAADVSQGALMVSAFIIPLGNFGRFCGVLVALGTVANLIPPTYSAGIDAQLLNRLSAKIPRAAWNTVAVVAYTVAALAGRDHLSEIFTNFLALMGYWVAIWLAITIAEHVLFRKAKEGDGSDAGWNWAGWQDSTTLPHGYAAATSFLIGWVGAILCMAQVYYVGPLAGLVGEAGIDVSFSSPTDVSPLRKPC